MGAWLHHRSMGAGHHHRSIGAFHSIPFSCENVSKDDLPAVVVQVEIFEVDFLLGRGGGHLFITGQGNKTN